MATKKNLLALAAKYDVEVDPKATNAVIETALLDSGKGIDLTEANDVAEETPEPEPVDSGDEVVVKMERQNWSYESCGYLFSQEHPYNVVKKSDVDHLVAEGGFRLATESELREYYG